MSGDLTSRLDASLTHWRQELAALRTGRATPAMVEHLPVACYGSTSPLQQVAAISAPEPRLLVIQPWDPTLVKDIEKAIQVSQLGINPVVEGKFIRLPIPTMTEERRSAMVRKLQDTAEQARVSVRGIREETLKDLKAQQKNGEVSEDDLTVATKKVQAAIDHAIGQINADLAAKEQELMTV